MLFTDASTVLFGKLATNLPDEEVSGATELVPGYVREAIRRFEVGGRLTLTPEVLWFAAHPINDAPGTRFGIPSRRSPGSTMSRAASARRSGSPCGAGWPRRS